MPATLFLSLSCVVLTGVSCYRYLFQPSPPPRLGWASQFESWHKRSLLTPHPDPHSFTPTRESLLLYAHYNAMGGSGITLALFSPPNPSGFKSEIPIGSVAVDGQGRVLLVTTEDTIGLTALAEQARNLPLHRARREGSWWAIKTQRSCHPVDKVYIPPPQPILSVQPEKGTMPQKGTTISVSAYQKGEKGLKKRMHGYSELPGVLWELFGLLKETEYTWKDPKDEVVLEKVMKLVEELDRD